MATWNDKPVRYLGGQISTRALNCLVNTGLSTIGDVAALSDTELLRLPNLGPQSLKEIRAVLPNLEVNLAAANPLKMDCLKLAHSPNDPPDEVLKRALSYYHFIVEAP